MRGAYRRPTGGDGRNVERNKNEVACALPETEMSCDRLSRNPYCYLEMEMNTMLLESCWIVINDTT